MSDQTTSRSPLISAGVVLLVLAAIIAWSSNPDAASFRRFISQQASQNAEGAMDRVVAKVLARTALETVNWDHVNFGFFSLVSFPDLHVSYFGAFGGWTRVEQQQTAK